MHTDINAFRTAVIAKDPSMCVTISGYTGQYGLIPIGGPNSFAPCYQSICTFVNGYQP